MIYILTHFVHGMVFMFFIFAALVLYHTPKRTHAQNYLLLCMVYWALLKLKDAFFCYPSYNEIAILQPQFTFLDLLGIPFVSFYLLEQVFPGRMSLRRCLILLFPFVFLIVIYCITTLFLPDKTYTTIQQLWEHIFYLPTFLRIIYIVYAMIYGVIVATYVLVKSYTYGKYLRSAYSYTDNLDLKWIRILVYTLFIYMAIYFYVLFNASIPGNIVFYMASILMWGFVFRQAMKQETPYILMNYWTDETRECDKLETQSEDTHERNKLLRDKLHIAFEKKKMHLNPKLTILDLAAECGTNRTYLSTYFNNVLNSSFYDYVNKYRIEHVSQSMLIKTNESNTIEEIALLSGFGSVSTFRRAFVKFTGVTPQEYKRSAALDTQIIRSV